MQVIGDHDMQKKLVILGLTLLIVSGFPFILRIFGVRSLYSGFLNVLSSEPQIQIIMILLIMVFQSLGLKMGIMVTVIGAATSPQKEFVENLELEIAP